MTSWWFLIPALPNAEQNKPMVVKLAGEYNHRKLKAFERVFDPTFLSHDEKNDQEPIDLLCVFDGDSADLVKVFKDNRFTESGIAYVEINRLKKGNYFRSPSRVFNLLKEFNFKGVGVYIVFPNFEKPKIYLPIFHPSSLFWYFDQMFWQDSWFKIVFNFLGRGLLPRFSKIISWIIIII